MNTLRTGAVLALGLALFGCTRPPPPPANPHYVLGDAYSVGGVWFYPRESYNAVETGLASVYPPDHPPLTTDGEVFDQDAMAAANATLQLPAIARLTNLENGRQVLVRINDRGTPTPHRLVQVTKRVAALLAMNDPAATRVRLEVLPTESHDAVDAVPGAPSLALQAAPRDAVQATALPPPGSVAGAAATPRTIEAATSDAAKPAAVQRLPETVTQGYADPGRLYIQLGTFQTFTYANIQRAQVGGLGANVVSLRDGRRQSYRVVIGPLTTVQEADRTLDLVIRAGVTDARIVVE